LLNIRHTNAINNANNASMIFITSFPGGLASCRQKLGSVASIAAPITAPAINANRYNVMILLSLLSFDNLPSIPPGNACGLMPYL
jgi:hypothetical protein